MKLISKKQIAWCFYREIKEGKMYMRPAHPFTIYSWASFSGEHYEIDGYRRTLKGGTLTVKSINDGWCRVSDDMSPRKDIYIRLVEMEQKPHSLLLLAICAIPFMVYNLLAAGCKIFRRKENIRITR